MDWTWWSLIFTVTYVLTLVCTYRIGFIRGYRKGGTAVVEQWKATLLEEEEK